MEGNQAWWTPQNILQVRELIAMLTLVWVIVYTYTRVIPRITGELADRIERAVLRLADEIRLLRGDDR